MGFGAKPHVGGCMTTNAYPICLAPVYRDYLWGGEKIARKYGRDGARGRVAESWEVADRADGMSVVTNGALRGRSLRELVEEGRLGVRGAFPLLVKILDAREALSVQVHPHNQTAAFVRGEAKSEMWYVLEAEPGAFVYAGLQPGVGWEDLLEAAKRGRVDEALKKIEVKASDAIYISGGGVHAIGAGCMMLEVQQNSNTTYRIYDWDRRDAHGQLRDLHWDLASKVVDVSYVGSKSLWRKMGEGHWSIVSSPDFQVERVDIRGVWEVERTSDSFQILFCLEGEGKLEIDGMEEALERGRTYLIPSCFGSGAISGNCQIIRVIL